MGTELQGFPKDWGRVPEPRDAELSRSTSLPRCCAQPWPILSPPAGSDDGTVRFWEVSTARCMKTLPVGGVVKSIAWNPSPTVCLVALAV